MLLEDEQHVLRWLMQYGTLPRAQVLRMLQKPRATGERILRNLHRRLRICDINDGYYIGPDKMCRPDGRIVTALWVLLHFMDRVEPMAHYPATYPSQLFFLKENVGYEIVVLYENEAHLSRLLLPHADLKYILVLPHIAMAEELHLPPAPCLFATVDYCGEEEPKVTFYENEDTIPI